MKPLKITCLIIALTLAIFYCQAQETKMKYGEKFKNVEKNAGTKSPIITTNLSYVVNKNNSGNKWANSFRPTFYRKHCTPEIQAIKESKLHEQITSKKQVPEDEKAILAVTPVMGTNFEGNWSVIGTPPDNTMAISNGGFIVTANNDGVEYYNSSGTYLYFDYWSDFFNDATLTSIIYDPKVIYDSGSDRFVMVVLHGITASTSKVIVCFSQSNNPQDGWWVYKLTGNPLNDNCWFDYPALGVSNNEIYVTGNLFYTGSSFNQSVIYQIPKSPGYSGGNISWSYWNNLSSSPYGAFTLFPASNGFQGNYGPGIYFVSNNAGGANQIRLWDLTDDLTGSPQLNSYTINTTSYSPAGDASQLGSTDLLDNGDCRIQNAFYSNGIVHLVFHSDIGSGWNGIFYKRINVSDHTIQSASLGASGSYNLSYPAVIPFSTSVNDKSVMIAYLRSSSSIYPQVRVVSCDNTMTWSTSTLIKSGDTFVDILTGDERWGDYTGISRKHNSTSSRIWLAGCYGANITSQSINNTFKTWVAEIYTTTLGSAPTANFSGSPLNGSSPLSVHFTDLTTNTPTTWSWSFSGATPSSSNIQNPTVVYNTPGVYPVSLTSSNGFGSDLETKSNYITVSGTAPSANFSGTPLNGNSPLHVQFTDLSTNTPTSWSWSFPGGTPSSSAIKNPVSIYNTPGVYSVSLTSSNGYGSDIETKTNYITVTSTADIEESDKASNDLKVFPNPVYDLIHITFDVQYNKELTIELIDISGNTIKTFYHDIPKIGVNRLTFNKGALSSGTYFVVFRYNTDIIKNEKIVILD